jgi:hypothetical protein
MSDRDDYEGYCLLSCDLYSKMTDVSEKPTTAQLREDIARFRFVFGRGWGQGALRATQEPQNSSVTTFEVPTEIFKLAPPEYTS